MLPYLGLSSENLQLFNIGMTFYELLSGNTPFDASGVDLDIIYSHMITEPKRLVEVLKKIITSNYHFVFNFVFFQVKPDIVEPLSDVVSKLMAKNAEDRYQSMVFYLFVIFFILF